jgi:HEAT repeat protein
VREQAVKSLGQLRDARATESLVTALEDVEGEVRAEGLQDAIQYLAQYRDPRVIPALIAQMRGYDSMGAAKHALLDLKAHVGREERAMIIAAIAADEREEQGKAQALYAARDSDAARDSEAPFSLETYRAIY